ncbi:MAG: 4Fe-4S dicluster domain-containing protein, partial [Burkholderiales bacterium]
MQTSLAGFIRDTPGGREAEAILRKCVHCGFCTATCPTYQVLGDDLDSPRGRIYLIKRALEGAPVTGRTRLHLDRCLTCRACETTCPSGVRYGRLVDIGREVVESRTRRGPWDRLKRAVLSFGLPRTALFTAALRLGRLAGMAPATRPGGAWPA